MLHICIAIYTQIHKIHYTRQPHAISSNNIGCNINNCLALPPGRSVGVFCILVVMEVGAMEGSMASVAVEVLLHIEQ